MPQSERLLHAPPGLATVGQRWGMCDPCPFRVGKSGKSRKTPFDNSSTVWETCRQVSSSSRARGK